MRTKSTYVDGHACGATDRRFICTLKKGHAGDHVAEGAEGVVWHRWDDSEMDWSQTAVGVGGMEDK